MGVNPKKNSNRKYYNIVGGNVARKFENHVTDGTGKQLTEERGIYDKQTKKLVKTVIEQYYDSIDGLIVDAFIKSHDQYGDSIELVILDEGEEFQFSIHMDSSYARSFLFRMPNLDITMPIELRPYNFEDKESGKKRVGISIIQKDSDYEKGKVPPYWTRENPGKLPEMEQVQKGSKLTWNSDKRDTYLYKAFTKWCKQFGVPEVAAPNDVEEVEDEIDKRVEAEYSEQAKEEQSHKPEITPLEDMEDDDLPF